MYTFESRIRYSEIDNSGRLSLEGLLNYFQDCSFFHSEDVNVGLSYLEDKHLAWVLSSWQIVINRYPAVCEKVAAGTAPYGFKGFLGYRNFWLDTVSGERLACANSVWTLLDTVTKRPARAPQDMVEAYEIQEKIDMDYAPRKIALPNDGVKQDEIVVKQHHLDTNQHVNNGQYIRMALDCMDGKQDIIQMRAEYKKSAVLNDIIIPVKSMIDKDTAVIMLLSEQQDSYCNVELKGKETC